MLRITTISQSYGIGITSNSKNMIALYRIDTAKGAKNKYKIVAMFTSEEEAKKFARFLERACLNSNKYYQTLAYDSGEKDEIKEYTIDSSEYLVNIL